MTRRRKVHGGGACREKFGQMGEVEERVLTLKGIGGPRREGAAQQERCEGMGSGVVLGEGGQGG